MQKWTVRNATGSMVPFSEFSSTKWTYNSKGLERFNGVSAYNVQGSAANGYSSGQAIEAAEEIISGMQGAGYAWSGVSYQEKISSGQAPALMRFFRHSSMNQTEKRRKEIVAAAKKCVAEKGFHAASVDMIAKAAKINVGQLYRYFDTKEAIIEAISQNVFDRTIREIRKHNGLKGLFKADKTDIQIMSEIHAEAARNPVVDQVMSNAEKRMAEVLKEEIKKTAPQISNEEIENAEAMLAVLTGGLFLLVLRRKNWPEKKTKKLADDMFRLVLPCLAQTTD